MKQSSSWEANQCSASQEIPRVLRNPMVHYNIHTRHLSLSWASSIQSVSPHPTSSRSIFILSSHLGLVLPSGLFPSYFLTNTLYEPLLSPYVCYMPRPSHSSRVYQAKNIWRGEHRSLSSSLCSFLHSSVTSSLLGPNILLNTLFSNTLSLRSSLYVSN